MRTGTYAWTIVPLLIIAQSASAQNPLIRDQFTADPTARVFDGRVYVYPSHDINCGTNWFCMQDYHVFSSENLVDWTDHGMIVHQDDVAWVDESRNAMWAPDAFERNGKYYFFFPAIADSAFGVRGSTVGVATSDTPHGPFTAEPRPIEGISGIDPNVFMDHDGQAYIYWAGGGALLGAKLKENMLELDSEPVAIGGFPDGFKEGPFLFERNDIYYFTFPHVIENTEALVYATGDNPLGPFEYRGIIMDEHPSRCWTNHHSILPYNDQWYLFYHHNDYSPDFDKNRAIRADSLFFNADGTIQKVTPTFRGVGVFDATDEIQIDRYSALSDEGAAIAFVDTSNTFAGWKTVFTAPGAWMRVNTVDFGNVAGAVLLRVRSDEGGRAEIRVGTGDAMQATEVDVPAGGDWMTVRANLSRAVTGINDLTLALVGNGSLEVDWIRFE